MPRKQKDDEQSVTSESKLMGEAEKFTRDQLYLKAIQCYTEVKSINSERKKLIQKRLNY